MPAHRTSLWLHLRIGLTSGLQGLRYHWGSAALLASTLLAAIATLLPVANLYGKEGDWLKFRPTVLPVWGGDWGLPWLVQLASPSTVQQEAAATLGSLLLGSLCGALVIALTGILTLGAARASATRDERLVQRAVGASRRMLGTGALLELAIIATGPFFLAVTIGLLAAHALARNWPGTLPPGSQMLSILSVTLLAAVFAAVLIVPALAAPRRVQEVEMHQELPWFPVVLQSALCLIVLVAGGTLRRRAMELSIDTRAPSHSGTVVSITTPASAARRSADFRRLLNNLKSAGMGLASLSSPGVLTGLGPVAMVLTECGQCRENGLSMSVRLKPAIHKIVSPDTFPLLGLRVLEGRGITDQDEWGTQHVAVVSRSLAAREFQDGEPIGRRIYTGFGDSTGSIVVGVVNDQSPLGLGGTLQTRYAVYLSVLQQPPAAVELLLRQPVGRPVLGRALAQAFGNVSGPYPITSEAAIRNSDVAPVHWFGQVFALQGWALTALAAFGILSYMTLWSYSLRGEIAVRRSVGARSSEVFRWLLWRSFGIAARGCAAGGWFGIAIWGALPNAVTGAILKSPLQVLPYCLLIVGLILLAVVPTGWRLSHALPSELLS
jgi:putative ABC transport system permease protein